MLRYITKLLKLLCANLKLSLVDIFPADSTKPSMIFYIIGTILQSKEQRFVQQMYICMVQWSIR